MALGHISELPDKVTLFGIASAGYVEGQDLLGHLAVSEDVGALLDLGEG